MRIDEREMQRKIDDAIVYVKRERKRVDLAASTSGGSLAAGTYKYAVLVEYPISANNNVPDVTIELDRGGSDAAG